MSANILDDAYEALEIAETLPPEGSEGRARDLLRSLGDAVIRVDNLCAELDEQSLRYKGTPGERAIGTMRDMVYNNLNGDTHA